MENNNKEEFNMVNRGKTDVRKMVTTAMLAAIIVVLQLMSSVMNISGFPITLTLVPIIIGATMYGPSTGAILGGVFGVVVCSGVIKGTDLLGHAMFQYNPVLTLSVCMLKGIAAGYVAGVVYRLFSKCGKKTLGTLISSILCPIVNTGMLCVVMIAFFESTIAEFLAASKIEMSVIGFMMSVILVANFLPELLLNVIVSPGVAKVVSRIKRD